MPASKQLTGPPVRFNWPFYALLGLATGPLVYAVQHDNGLAAVGYAALCGLWVAYGRVTRALALSRVVLAALLDAANAMYLEMTTAQLAAAEKSRLSGPGA